MSDQELKELKLRTEIEEGIHQSVETLLEAVKINPNMYLSPRLLYLRNFVSFVNRNDETFSVCSGDDTIELAVPRGPDTTEGYVKALSELRSGSDIVGWDGTPILTVYSTETQHYNEVTSLVNDNEKQRVKLTHMRLVDGSGDQIHARLAVNLTESGRLLKRGDKLRLDSYTELSYRVNKQSPRMPALFIHALSRLGNVPLQDETINNQIPVTVVVPSEHNDEYEPSKENIIDPRKDKKPECTDENRCCAVYGIRFLKCVCVCIPVNNHNLKTIKEDCYFATDDIDDMPNNHKRNMLYWWYATNVFSISGKGKRGKLPVCLEYAIREAYPNPEGMSYKGHRDQKKN